jgi:dTDP-4-amino-4,6-dideoxygalactose transaminase
MYRSLPSALPARLPVTARAAQEVICQPIYPGLSEEQVRNIAAMIGVQPAA